MSSTSQFNRDERTVAVETASYQWAYLFLSYGLLIVAAYRSFVHEESPWDLIGLVILGGIVCTVLQRSIWTARLGATILLTFVLSFLLAVFVVLLR